MRRFAQIASLLAVLSGCMAVVPIPVQIGPGAGSGQVTLANGPGSTDSFGRALNAERAAAGLGPVVINPQLVAAARGHAQDMASRGYFNHRSQDGRSFAQRARAAGYVSCNLAENIAMGQRSEPEVLAAWMASAGHRRNNLNPQVNEYGIARAGDIWVLMLGRRC